MNISEQNIQHIADLARLGIPENEVQFYAQEISHILQYIDKLNEVDVDEEQLKAYITFLHSQTRPDSARALWGVVESKELLEQADQTHNGFIKVQAILDKSNE